MTDHLTRIETATAQPGDLAALTAECRAARDRIAALEARLAASQSNCGAWSKHTKKLRTRIAALEAALQDKCHGLPETDYVAFCDGCDKYQREQFGRCRTAELEAEVERLRADVKRLQAQLNVQSTAAEIAQDLIDAAADINELRADAERLNCLENSLQRELGIGTWFWHLMHDVHLRTKTLRDGIDAARQQEQANG